MGRGGYWPAVRSQGKRLVVWLVAAAIVLTAVGLVYFEDPYEALHGSVEAVRDDGRAVERTDGGYVRRPADASLAVGVAFYPGERAAPVPASDRSPGRCGRRTSSSSPKCP